MAKFEDLQSNGSTDLLRQYLARYLRLAGDVIPGPGAWESHGGFPEAIRPRQEAGQLGVDLLGPGSLDLGNVIQPAWPPGAYQGYWNRKLPR